MKQLEQDDVSARGNVPPDWPIYDLPYDFVLSDFTAMLVDLAKRQVSDITIATDRPVMAKIHGRQMLVVRRALHEHETRKLLEWMYGANASAEIGRMRALDKRYEINLGSGRRQSFRMNAIGCLSRQGVGLHITLRALPIEIPRLQDMAVPKEIVDSIDIGKGMFAIVGETGSGKSTLLAAMMNHVFTYGRNRKIVTFEAPIEFDMSGLASDTNLIVQSEIGENLTEFYLGVRAALRQGPTDILIGEARDLETIKAALTASETGHATYVTVHAESVRSTFTRIAQEFPTDAFDATIFKLIAQMRVIVCQRLAMPASGQGKRIPIREWLVLTPALRLKLSKMPSRDALNAIEQEVINLGQTFADQAIKAYREGLINQAELAKFIGDKAFTFTETPVTADGGRLMDGGLLSRASVSGVDGEGMAQQKGKVLF